VVIRSGSSGLPAVLWANDMVTPANTSPASTPPTAPRSSRATSASSTCLRCIATMGDHLPAGSLPDTWRTAEPADPITAGRAGTTGRQALRTGVQSCAARARRTRCGGALDRSAGVPCRRTRASPAAGPCGPAIRLSGSADDGR
jgi:hypothetical protein